jgi:tetratricopeptide (TPR) repeat protein/predicted Ser/Thr protein kinase
MDTVAVPSGAAARPAVSKTGIATGLLSPPPGTLSQGPTLALPPSPPESRRIVHLEPGAEFGSRYRMDGLLGEGGMGKVYKAYDQELNRPVALKLVRPEYAADPQAMARLKQELLLASRISHKHILRIHDLGDVAGVKFISMAYVDGADLYELIQREGRLPIDRSLEIARQLCAALDAAHSEEVVHRDLKPRNILVDRSGHVYVSDFGLAKSLEAGATMMTRTGQIMGTPAYMSPEQVEARPADHRSDIYSLGMIFYEMVTGDLPFTAESTLQLMYAQVNEKPKDPKQLNPEVPDYLVRIILRCLEKDPARRYQHVSEILCDLEAARVSAPRPPARSLTIQIPRPTRKTWLRGAVVAVVLAALGASVPFVKDRVVRRSAPASGTAAAAGEVRYLAVLPFRVQGAGELHYEAEGVVEALSAKLIPLRSVHLASPAAVERALKRGSVEKTARSLGVTLVIQGVVEGSGDRIKILVSLDDMRAGKRVWQEEFSGLRQDLLTIQDQIYGRLVSALDLKLGNEELARGATRPTENIEAYQVYLRGRNALRGQRDVKNLTAALDLFNEALKQDPRFALAYAGVADASLALWNVRKESEWAQRALGAAHRAQQLNDNLPEVHFALGTAYANTGRTAEAIAEVKRALELAPNSDEGYRRLGGAYVVAGRQAEAIDAYTRAIEVNPYYWYNYNQLGAAYLQVGRNDKAMEAFRRVIDMDPDNPSGHLNLGVTYYRQGKWSECIPAFQKAVELQPSFRGFSNLGVSYFYLGRYHDARQMFEKAVGMNPNDHTMAGNLADAYRWLGQADKAHAGYDRAIGLAYKFHQVNPRHAGILGSLALYYAKKGDAGRALEFIRRARDIDANDNSLMYKEAVIHAIAGRPAEALAGLRGALQKGYPPKEAENDPELKKLRGRPEFDTLLREFRPAGA